MRRTVFSLGVLAAIALGVAGCGGGDAEGGEGEAAAASQAPLRTVRVARVEVRPLQGGMTASGQLVSREEAAVGSEIAGYRVARVLADVGDTVSAGQPLVALDDTLIRAQVDQAAASLRAQEVAAQQAEREAQRVAGLAQEGVVAQELVEQRRSSAANAAAQAAAARAQLAELQTRRQRLTVRAPVSGRVLERTIRPGDIAGGGGEPWFRIARGGLVELAAEVPESDLTRVGVGDPAQVTLPSGRTATGTVRLVSPIVDPETKLGRVRILLQPGPDQRPGGFARATFAEAGAAGPSAPEPAVRYDSNGAFVLALTNDDRVRRVAVRTGDRAGGRVELVQGPEPGTRVLLGGGAFVLEGDKVRPVFEQAAAPRPGATR